jgi:hypothetical protein
MNRRAGHLVSTGMSKHKLMALAVATIGVVALSGCGSKSTSPSTGSPAGTVPPATAPATTTGGGGGGGY